MNARTLRRAQERKARKEARKEQNQLLRADTLESLRAFEAEALSLEVEAGQTPPTDANETLSEARLLANQANSKLSTGPRTPEGRAKSSRNAVTTALTGRTVLLPTDDVDLYERHLDSFFQEFDPIGVRETALVQSLADHAWRLERIVGLEMAIYSNGCSQFAEQYAHESAAAQKRLIELQITLTHERQLRNLQVQEARLCRRREKESAELRQLQEERKLREKSDLKEAAALYQSACEENQPFDPADHGFDFPIEDIQEHLADLQAQREAQAEFSRLASLERQREIKETRARIERYRQPQPQN